MRKVLLGGQSLLFYAIALMLFLVASPLWADEPIRIEDDGMSATMTAETLSDNLRMDEISVVGSKENIRQIAGSAAYIDVQQMSRQSYVDINRVLKDVPGVYVREEDGFGLFPNISLRGVDSGRSQKLTIMEDGILTAPAPYSAPSAYYFPSSGRMSAIEVLKGSSQVEHGPHTTGGVMNFLSTKIPGSEQYYMNSLFGTNMEMRNHIWFGNTHRTKYGNIGFVVENWFRQTDGFKTINSTPDFRNGDDTGFVKVEPMIKVSWEPKTSMYQKFEAKMGYTNLDANESYLGITDQDFVDDPYQRYPATRFSRLETEHWRSYVRHYLEINPTLNITTTAYGNVFERNWQKEHNCRAGGILPSNEGLGTCLGNTAAGALLLKGEAPGIWRLRNNNREYYLYGGDMVARKSFKWGQTEHKVQGGVRLHYDQIRRFQTDEQITQAGNGSILTRTELAPGGAGSRRQGTFAIATHIKDTIKWKRFTFTPGFRYEQLYQEWDELAPSTPAGGDDDFGVWAAGGGLNYNWMDNDTHVLDTFTGIHRGFSTPSPRAFLKDGVKEETSVGYEVGVRYNNKPKAVQTELIWFLTDFDDLLVTDIAGAGGALDGSNANVGEVRSWGFEGKVQYDPGVHRNWVFQLPMYANFTYTNAEITDAIPSADSESIFQGAQNGNEVPYIPEWQFNVGTGLIYKKFSMYLDGHYVDSTFTTANNSSSQINPITGELDALFGDTDEYFVLDISTAWQFNENVKVYTNFRNVADAEYMIARHPQGPRPGAPFQMFGGLEISLF